MLRKKLKTKLDYFEAMDVVDFPDFISDFINLGRHYDLIMIITSGAVEPMDTIFHWVISDCPPPSAVFFLLNCLKL